MRVERRLETPRWLPVVVPMASVLVAMVLAGVVLLATQHDPVHTFSRLVERGFTGTGALTQTLVAATPLLFTGLAAAVAFRMQVWNIGGEGQLYAGAIGASGIGLALGGRPGFVIVLAMVAVAILAGMLWAMVPAILRAWFSTNEIITSLMLNYLAGLLLTYLIFDSHSYWRDLTSFSGKTFPQGKPLPAAAEWPATRTGLASFDLTVPMGFFLGVALAAGLWVLFRSTRFGFEVRVIGDSPNAAAYAGMRTRRKVLSVMALSGAVAGIGGASQIGDFRHVLDPRGLEQSGFGYTGIVVAALARYNPFAVVVVAVILGGVSNAGYSLQGPDFPAGLVGVLQGMILFCALGGELLVRYRVRFRSPARAIDAAPVARAAS